MNVKLLHAESAEYAEKQYKSLRSLHSPRDLKFNTFHIITIHKKAYDCITQYNRRLYKHGLEAPCYFIGLWTLGNWGIR